MTIATTRRLIIEVLEGCQLEPRARSLLQKALAESWQVAPIRTRENAPPELTPRPGGASSTTKPGDCTKLAMDSQTGSGHTDAANATPHQRIFPPCESLYWPAATLLALANPANAADPPPSRRDQIWDIEQGTALTLQCRPAGRQSAAEQPLHHLRGEPAQPDQHATGLRLHRLRQHRQFEHDIIFFSSGILRDTVLAPDTISAT